MIENFPTYRADLGVITQADGDSGDSAQRTATFVVLASLIEPRLLQGRTDQEVYDKMIPALRVSPFRYRRSPFPGWFSDPTNFSRDQHSILMLAMASVRDEKELSGSMREILKRGGFHQNFLHGADDPERRWKWPDVLVPSEISVWIRGNRLWWLYPLLPLLDLGFMVDLRLRRGSHDYDNMLAQNLMFAVTCIPTPVGILAFHFYRKTDFMERIQRYHSKEMNGVPGMSDLFLAALKKTLEVLCVQSCFFRWLSFSAAART